MGIYLDMKQNKRGKDYLFVDELSKACYENALFRFRFYYDSLKAEQIEIIDEYLQNMSNNLIEVLNGSDETSLTSGSHEDRIKALENEILTLTNNINSQTTKHGILNITPTSLDMDFSKDGTMIKFTNTDGGVYTTGILQENVKTEIVLPIGIYTVNIVNSLNDMKDSIFEDVWENATSDDGNHTMDYVVLEETVEIATSLAYEQS